MSIVQFVTRLSSGLSDAGRYRTCAALFSAARSVVSFSGDTSLSLASLYTAGFLRRYQEHLEYLGRKRNTISFYMSMLRSVYYVALAMGKVDEVPGLFDGVFTGNDPTEKRAIDPGIVGIIGTADLSGKPHLEECRALFMLSFFLQGMAFVDLAYLRKSDIRPDSVVYRRHKTNSLIAVPILGPVKAILSKYAAATKDSPYVLPILTATGKEANTQYESALRKQNRRLKVLAEYLGINENLTSYVARHSWATIAHHNDVSMAVLSQAMGHQTEDMTRRYLASFGDDRLTEANLIVLQAILGPIYENNLCSEERLLEMGYISRNMVPAMRKSLKKKGKYDGRLGGGGLSARKEKCPSTRD